MEIYLDKRAVRQIRVSALDAIEEGDNETLKEDIVNIFSEDQIEEIERRIDSGDFSDFVSEVLDEWGGDDIDELMELLESHLTDAGIDLKFTTGVEAEEEEEEEEEEVSDEEEELGLVEDEVEDEVE